MVGIVVLGPEGWIHGAQSPPDGHEDAGGGGFDGPGSILRGLGPGRGLGHHHLHQRTVARDGSAVFLAHARVALGLGPSLCVVPLWGS